MQGAVECERAAAAGCVQCPACLAAIVAALLCCCYAWHASDVMWQRAHGSEGGSARAVGWPPRWARRGRAACRQCGSAGGAAVAAVLLLRRNVWPWMQLCGGGCGAVAKAAGARRREACGARRGPRRPRVAGGISAGRVDMKLEERQALQEWQDEGASGSGGRRRRAAAAAGWQGAAGAAARGAI